MKKLLVFLFLMAIGTSVYAQSSDLITDKGYIKGNSSTANTQYYFGYIDGVLYEMVDGYDIQTFVHYTHPVVLVKFPQNKNVTTYTIPAHTSVIAKGAFQGNKNIQTIRIPSSVSYIGDNAFADCENLKSIEVYTSSSSIQAVEEDRIEKEEIGRYNINGVKVEETDDGVQIILYSDGSADKILKY